jgi:hypothetical protein
LELGAFHGARFTDGGLPEALFSVGRRSREGDTREGENGKQETGSIAHRIPSILGPITKVPEAIRVCLSSPSLVVDRAQEILEAII